MDGLELLRQVKEQLGDLTFVLITAQGSVDTAVSP
jgi:DNA-binding NtrC family response regulator